jgi:hypothetical protein
MFIPRRARRDEGSLRGRPLDPKRSTRVPDCLDQRNGKTEPDTPFRRSKVRDPGLQRRWKRAKRLRFPISESS